MATAVPLPGVLCCFVAFVLLIFVSFSPPTWNSVYFLHAGTGPDEVRFGVFGYTGSSTSVGYHFPAPFDGYNNGRLSSHIIHGLTIALILHPIVAGLSGLAVLFGIFGTAHYTSATLSMAIICIITFICTAILWIIDMALWGIARGVLRHNGVSAQYGNANWLTLGALGALYVGIFVCSMAAGDALEKRHFDNNFN